jgi:hemerythrin-like domain-containing protein
MADDKTKRGSPDSTRLNKSEAYEVAYARKKANAGNTPRKATARRGSARAPAAPVARKRAGPKPTVRSAPHPPTEEKTAQNTAPRTMKTADAVDLLTDDHLAVTALFQRYERLAKRDGGAAERRALAQQVCAMLKVHTQIEEELFYPAARDALDEENAEMIDEAEVEHSTVKDLIAELADMSPSDDLYDAKVKVLSEYVRHHVQEEEDQIFPAIRDTDLDLETLGEDVAARREQLMDEYQSEAEQ